jgi:hypothetical protein
MNVSHWPQWITVGANNAIGATVTNLSLIIRQCIAIGCIIIGDIG